MLKICDNLLNRKFNEKLRKLDEIHVKLKKVLLIYNENITKSFLVKFLLILFVFTDNFQKFIGNKSKFTTICENLLDSKINPKLYKL